jgi:hypothetical protein
MEEIGNGPLAKMVRLALSDPDNEVWAYSIHVADAIYTGTEIASLEGLTAALGSGAAKPRNDLPA